MTQTPGVAHPTLYGLGPNQCVVIFGQRCQKCGKVSFPRQTYGCESCGAHGEDLRPADLAPRGELVSFTVVHRHFGRDIKVPFVMAEVRLASGPLLRCTLVQRDDTGLKPGSHMVGELIANEDAGSVPELRFRRIEA